MANTTKRTRPATELNDKPAVRNYGSMAKGQPKSSKTKKTTAKKGK